MDPHTLAVQHAYQARMRTALEKRKRDPNRERLRSLRIAEYAAQLHREGWDLEAATYRAQRAYSVHS